MVTVRTEPTNVASANVEDFSIGQQICVFSIVGGILLTFVGIFFFKPLTMIGVIMAFGAAGIFIFSIWREVEEDEKKMKEDAAKTPSEPTESAKAESTEGICPHCGKFIGYDGNEYCTFCGNKILK